MHPTPREFRMENVKSSSRNTYMHRNVYCPLTGLGLCPGPPLPRMSTSTSETVGVLLLDSNR